MILATTILFANLARFGYRDNAFAKRMLFLFGVLVACHTFFGLLSWQYARRNKLFG